MSEMWQWAGIHPILFTLLAISLFGASAAALESIARIFYRE